MSTMVATQREIALERAFPPHPEITPEELLAMPDGGHYELVDGELRERQRERVVELWSRRRSRTRRRYLSTRTIWAGSSAPTKAIAVFPGNPTRSGGPTSSFIRKDRYPWNQLSVDEFMAIPPDLAVEVVFRPMDLVSNSMKNRGLSASRGEAGLGRAIQRYLQVEIRRVTGTGNLAAGRGRAHG